MKIKSTILIALACALGLLFTGCDPEDLSIGGFSVYEVSGNVVAQDQHGNTLLIPHAEAEAVADMAPAQQQQYLTARFRQDFPDSYADPSATAEVTMKEGEPYDVNISSEAEAAVSALNFIPGYGQIASVIANGLLGIGALWYRRKKSTAEKVSESLIKGIDTFRDVLDQTPQGEAIDERLKAVLRERQLELQTADEVNSLLQRYATPTKQPIVLNEAA